MDFELVIQVIRYRISHWAVPDHLVSQRILMQVESIYNRGIKKLKSPEYTLHDGLTTAIPWSDKLNEFKVILFYLDDKLKMELGQGRFVIPTDYHSFHDKEGNINRVIIEIFPNGGDKKIAKILCNLCVHRLYAGSDEDHIPPPERRHKDIFNKPIPGFRFKRLAKAINWNKVKAVDLEKTIETTDVRSVLTCLDDVAFGDAAEEDAEPALVKGLQLSQFTVQYLLCSQDVMKEKKNIIHDALKTFQKEEDLLDLKIAKLRARNKAMKRELSEMDMLAENYHTALKRLEPHLKERILRDRAVTLKDRLQSALSDRSTSDVQELSSNSDLSDEDRKTRKLRSKLLKPKSKVSNRKDRNSDDKGEERSSSLSGWKSVSTKEPTVAANSWSRSLMANDEEPSEDSNPRKVITKSIDTKPVFVSSKSVDRSRYAEDEEDGEDDGISAWKSSLPSNPKISANSKAEVETISTHQFPPSVSTARTVPIMQTTVSSDRNQDIPVKQEIPMEVKDVRNASGGGTVVMKSVSIEPANSSRDVPSPSVAPTRQVIAAGKSASASIHYDMQDELPKQVSSNTMASTTGFSTGIMSVDSLSNTANGGTQENDTTISGAGQVLSDTIDVVKGSSVNNNTRPSLNTWTPSSSSSKPLLVKSSKYGAQYLDDDEEEEVDNNRFSLSKTAPTASLSMKTTISREPDHYMEAKSSNRNYNREEGSVSNSEKIDADANPKDVNSGGLLKPLDLTLSSAGDESVSQYNNDTFDSPDYKRDPYSDRDESLMYSDSKQWNSSSKADAKAGYRRPSYKGDDSSNMSISVDSDPMPHLRMLESSKPSSITGNNSTDAFISSPDESGSYMTRLTMGSNATTSQANNKNNLVVGTGSNNLSGKLDTNDVTGDSSSMFTAIDTSKSLVIDLDIPGINDNNQDSSYNGGESSITISQPNTFSTKGTPYGFHNNTHNRFRKYDDFDVDDQDEMNLGTMTTSKANINGNKSGNGQGEFDDVMMNISEGSSSLNYTSTSFSAPPTRDFPSDYNHGNFSPRRENNDDDMVLMGTGKFGRGTTSGLNGDTMEKDSLAGTMESNFNGGGTGGSLGGGVGDTILQSNESLSFAGGQGGNSNRESGQGLRFGSTLDSDNGKNASYGSTPFDNYSNNTSAFENSRPGSEYTEDNTFVSDPNHTMDDTHLRSTRNSLDQSDVIRSSVESNQSNNELVWKLGRAPLDLIELAQAFEVHLSGVAFTSSVRDRGVVADFEFLDVKAPKSSVIRITTPGSFQPISYSAHMIFNDETENMLKEEIAEIGDSMTFQINFYSAADDRLIGQAVVELWVMIEDCCNIVRKEIDIYTVDMSSVIGTAVVDVKGYAILIRCSEE